VGVAVVGGIESNNLSRSVDVKCLGAHSSQGIVDGEKSAVCDFKEVGVEGAVIPRGEVRPDDLDQRARGRRCDTVCLGGAAHTCIGIVDKDSLAKLREEAMRLNTPDDFAGVVDVTEIGLS
jgi:hypothetical protein